MNKKTQAMAKVVRAELEAGLCPDQTASYVAYSSSFFSGPGADVSNKIPSKYCILSAMLVFYFQWLILHQYLVYMIIRL